jgi:CBS domain-containing protein
MICPACGAENIAGVDRCEDCMAPFRDLDVPQPREGLQAHIMLDPVRNLYSEDPAMVAVNDSVQSAVEIMRQRRAGCVLVVQEDKLAGILTEVDLLLKLGDDRDMPALKVSDLMTPKPEVMEEDSPICSALRSMSLGGYRHLPVVRQGSPVGIVSVKDIMRYLKKNLL